ncbi:hypothetical protein Bbelb_096170, partial [Branchiostoma belcheri]
MFPATLKELNSGRDDNISRPLRTHIRPRTTVDSSHRQKNGRLRQAASSKPYRKTRRVRISTNRVSGFRSAVGRLAADVTSVSITMATNRALAANCR